MIHAELLTESTELHFQRMLANPNFGFQEKFNGHRLIICKQDGTLRIFNREGGTSTKPLPLIVRAALMNHPLTTFIIDGELVAGDNLFYIFDALMLGDEVLSNDTYEYREARYHSVFDNYAGLHPVETARAQAAKERLWWMVKKTQGEGLVAKDMRKSYRQGRADQHFKLKFWKTADAFVIGPSQDSKNGVEIGMLDAKGRIHRISGCSMLVKAAQKQLPQPGDVIEVRFLYATKERHIVQPTMLRLRDDKRAAECKLTQLDPYINKNWKLI